MKTELRPDAGAFLTSKHPVYAVGEPIDLSLWIKAVTDLIAPSLEIHDDQGRLIPEQIRNSNRLAAWIVSRVTPGVNNLATAPDLRRWFNLEKPGQYTVAFLGRTTGLGGQSLELRSNTMRFVICKQVESELIPLDLIWALDMPGTRPMNRTGGGDPLAHYASEGRLVDEIRAALIADLNRGSVTGDGFAVRGRGLDALSEARAVLVGNQAPTTSFPFGEPISLVFYARGFNDYVYLQTVERRDSEIQITYRFVPHRTKEITSQLALIPLPTGVSGLIRVNIKPAIDPKTINLDWGVWARKVVSGSFSLRLNKHG